MARRTDDTRLRNGYRPEERLGSMNRVVEKSVELHTYRMGANNIELRAFSSWALEA